MLVLIHYRLLSLLLRLVDTKRERTMKKIVWLLHSPAHTNNRCGENDCNRSKFRIRTHMNSARWSELCNLNRRHRAPGRQSFWLSCRRANVIRRSWNLSSDTVTKFNLSKSSTASESASIDHVECVLIYTPVMMCVDIECCINVTCTTDSIAQQFDEFRHRCDAMFITHDCCDQRNNLC